MSGILLFAIAAVFFAALYFGGVFKGHSDSALGGANLRVVDDYEDEEEEEDEDEKEPAVKVIVTYMDGTKETFRNDDGEVNIDESGAVSIRADEDHCVTISPHAYKKIEETLE